MKTIGITLGDPHGIGPEITAKALDFFNRNKILCNFIVIGNKKSFEKACQIAGINGNFKCIKEFIDIKAKLDYKKQPTKIGGEVSYKAIYKSSILYKDKLISAIVTAPISKKSLHLAGYNFDGHTGLLGHLFDVKEPLLMLANKRFSTLHVTCHLSLSKAISKITENRVFKTIKLGNEHLIKKGIMKPKLGMCGLNPHAGEDGFFGREEINIIKPAVLRAKKEGINIDGPISPDIIFRNANSGKYDLVIANYHDQGHIPVKLIYFDQSVNVTLGVPLIRTSVDHGTAFDISFTNKAKAINMVAAIIYALKMI